MEQPGALYRQEPAPGQNRDEGRSPSPPGSPSGWSLASDPAVAALPRSPDESSSQQQAPAEASSDSAHSADHALSAQDVLHKTCFICCGSEDEEDADKQDEWIHACDCSLMAHQSCLLTWVSEAQYRQRMSNLPMAARAVNCPSCGTPYKIMQRRNALLDLIERFDRPLDRLALYLSATTVTVGTLCASAAYGILATAAFLGPQATYSALAGNLAPAKAMRLATIAPLLIASRTRLIDGVIGAVLPLSVLLDYEPDTVPIEAGSLWPPSPRLSIILMLITRKAYQALYRVIWRRVLRTVPSPALIHAPDRPLIAIVPAAEPAMEVQGQAGVAEDGEGGEERPAAAVRRPEQPDGAQFGISVTGLARMCMGALLWPFLSSAAGSALLWLVTPSDMRMIFRPVAKPGFLRTFLGLGEHGVFCAALGWTIDKVEPNPPLLGERFVSTLDPVDPIWWRNTIGGCLLVLAKDVSALVRALLERKRLSSRQIVPVEVARNLDVELR